MNAVRLGIVAVAVVISSMLLGAGVYESVVFAPNLMGAPASLEHARGFLHATNPGTLFRVLSPLNQVMMALALVLSWKWDRQARWILGLGLVCAVLGDLITFLFHYPRNAILFRAPLTQPAADFDRVAGEWAMGNHVRVAVVAISVACAVIALIRTARSTSAPHV